ncbi:MAG: Maf family nucleotide pyrophosphatase [Bifidobacteriaceae bacterium]|jgi:septum formation protein|nr:Maf family nucleotide pyrophosphatase [Bifidobacteriaceae bacterium]
MRLVLASASPARLATLQAAGIDPIVRLAPVDEAAILAAALAREPGLLPAAQVTVLARAKAEAVAADPTIAAEDFILGCDSMLELDGEVLGKPRDAEDAARRIRQQAGRTGLLHTGHWLIGPRPDNPKGTTGRGAGNLGRRESLGTASSTLVRFGPMNEAEIAAYVATGEPLHVAGAFTIDGLGGPFIEGIDGDHHGVVGLSLPTLRHLLNRFGLSVFQFWRTLPPDKT